MLDRSVRPETLTRSLVPLAATGIAAGMLGIALSPGIEVALFCSAVVGAAFASYNIVMTTTRQECTPSEWRGRADALYRFLPWGVLPVGSLTGGLVAEAFGLGAPAFATALAAVAAAALTATAGPHSPTSVRHLTVRRTR